MVIPFRVFPLDALCGSDTHSTAVHGAENTGFMDRFWDHVGICTSYVKGSADAQPPDLDFVQSTAQQVCTGHVSVQLPCSVHVCDVKADAAAQFDFVQAKEQSERRLKPDPAFAVVGNMPLVAACQTAPSAMCCSES